MFPVILGILSKMCEEAIWLYPTISKVSTLRPTVLGLSDQVSDQDGTKSPIIEFHTYAVLPLFSAVKL